MTYNLCDVVLLGLHRCGKSCRLRWINYLRPDIKRGNFEQDEEDLIIKLHALLGNRYVPSIFPSSLSRVKYLVNIYIYVDQTV